MIISRLAIFFCLLIMLQSQVYCQANKNYTNAELTCFTEVYLGLKEIKIDSVEEKVSRILADSKLSIEAYGALIRNSSVNPNMKIDSSFGPLLSEIKIIQNDFQNSQEEIKKAGCQKCHLDLETYQSIEQDFRADPRFQQQLKPYFSSYFQNKRR